jgi:Na+/proline symporter
MAATMSTLSSAINSVANLGVEDFVRPFKPDLKDKQAMMLGKIFTFILGLSGIVFALILAKSNLASIWDLALMLTGMVYAPMVGIFLLGIFTKRANTAGVAAGVVLSIILSVWMKENLSPHIFFYFPVSVFACFIGGYVMSIVVPCRAVSLEGLTVYSLPKEVVNDSTAQ